MANPTDQIGSADTSSIGVDTLAAETQKVAPNVEIEVSEEGE